VRLDHITFLSLPFQRERVPDDDSGEEIMIAGVISLKKYVRQSSLFFKLFDK